MTFVSRLMDAKRHDRAIVMLDEISELIQKDPDKKTEVLLLKSLCFFAKQDNDSALHYVTMGLNAHADDANEKHKTDEEVGFSWMGVEKAVAIANAVFNRTTKSIAEVVNQLEKAAARLTQEDRFKSVIKLENIRASIDYYRAVLVLQPNNKNAMLRLASCFAKFGKSNLAITILSQLIDDGSSALDLMAFAVRAACYREISKTVRTIFAHFESFQSFPSITELDKYTDL